MWGSSQIRFGTVGDDLTPGILSSAGRERKLVEALELYHPNMKATNTREAPNTVVPVANTRVRIDGDKLTVRLKPGSWNVIVTQATDRSI